MHEKKLSPLQELVLKHEFEILQLLARGKTVSEIGKELSLDKMDVGICIAEIYMKMHVNKRLPGGK